ncbi:MAG: hypothetical protein AMJ46_13890 [Latescibacteria bacterium DG_63]|jgi:hypothetical protein|nr:MAG: hypothetical protein AMJ46_13890 [Latescibacteria bacterium DG_63]
MSKETYTELVLREFRRLKRLADQAMAQVGDQDFFAPHDVADNSIAVVVKHMAGNMHSRWRDFLTSDGEKPDRKRDREFVLAAEDTRQFLISRWESGWELLFNTLAPLGDDDLRRTVTIRGEPFTVLQAINRQLTHYAYHVGQIVYAAKYFAGDGWKSLSVPKGKSEEFNLDPKPYLDESEA